MIPINKGRSRLNVLKKVRVVAYFLELHENIQKLNTILTIVIVDCADVAGEYLFIELLLQLGQANGQMYFLLLRQSMLFFYLETSEHERSKKSVDL